MKKKLLLVAMVLSLGTLTFANVQNNHHSETNQGNNQTYHANYCGTNMNGKSMMDRQQKMDKTHKFGKRHNMNNPAFTKYREKMQTIHNSINTEMAKENPNFDTISSLNKELGNIRAEMRTERLKMKKAKTTN